MRIGIVHDNPDTAVLFSQLIEDIGFELAWVERSGSEAIEKCRQDLPDLLLVKLALPDCHGVEVIRRIMQYTPTTIIAVSQSVKNNPGKVFEAMSVGALDAFTEPCSEEPESINELKRKIRNVANCITVRKKPHHRHRRASRRIYRW